MKENVLFFSDNFFSAGRTSIYDVNKEIVGDIDLQSFLTSGITVLDQTGEKIVNGKFGALSNKWKIFDNNDQQIGELKQKLTLFSKKYEYTSAKQQTYRIQGEAFSKEYEIVDGQDNIVGKFEKVSGFFSSAAYKLSNFSEQLANEELIAVVMGVNALEKRRNSNNS
jgi:uncharacterized protein YxjI